MLRMATLFHQVRRSFMSLPDLNQLLLVTVVLMFAEMGTKAALAVVYVNHRPSSP